MLQFQLEKYNKYYYMKNFFLLQVDIQVRIP